MCGQKDSANHLFKPGTLVGKYYGTYDTTSKKPAETQKVAGIDAGQSLPQQQTDRTGLAPRQSLQTKEFDTYEISGTKQASELKVNQLSSPAGSSGEQKLSNSQGIRLSKTIDPVEVSGTSEAAQIDVTDQRIKTDLSDRGLSVQSLGNINRNPVPVVPGKAVAHPSEYQDTRLGSSSPLYNTYRTNDNGAGAITTNPNKGGSRSSVAGGEASNQKAFVPHAPVNTYRDTRLGSSSPLYNTYRTNDNGAGSVTNNPNKGGGGATIAVTPASQNTRTATTPAGEIYRPTRLGSSSPVYNTYRSNNNGAGSVTTNPNKGGGSVALPLYQQTTGNAIDSTTTGRVELKDLRKK